MQSDINRAFLNNFINDAQNEELRNKIYNFLQGTTEAFKASWIRFRAYQRDCPHHGFSEIQILNIFFRGLDWTYQATLDARSQGNFKTRSTEEATRLIENVATSTSAKKTDLERRMLENWNGDRISKTFPHEGDEEEHVDLINETGFAYRDLLIRRKI